jgi:hypothetical protein
MRYLSSPCHETGGMGIPFQSLGAHGPACPKVKSEAPSSQLRKKQAIEVGSVSSFFKVGRAKRKRLRSACSVFRLPMSARSKSKVEAPTKGMDPRQFTEADVAAIAERLERNEYPTVFGCLEDWHALRAIAFYAPRLGGSLMHICWSGKWMKIRAVLAVLKGIPVLRATRGEDFRQSLAGESDSALLQGER